MINDWLARSKSMIFYKKKNRQNIEVLARPVKSWTCWRGWGVEGDDLIPFGQGPGLACHIDSQPVEPEPELGISFARCVRIDHHKSAKGIISRRNTEILIHLAHNNDVYPSVVTKCLPLKSYSYCSVHQNESFSLKWELPCLPPSSLELWRRERASRQLSFW